jgi:hypothetical protein
LPQAGTNVAKSRRKNVHVTILLTEIVLFSYINARSSSDVSCGLISVINYLSRYCYIIDFVTEKRVLK